MTYMLRKVSQLCLLSKYMLTFCYVQSCVLAAERMGGAWQGVCKSRDPALPSRIPAWLEGLQIVISSRAVLITSPLFLP